VTIRMRLTVWYVGVMFVSLVAMGLLVYHEFVIEPRNDLREARETGKPLETEQEEAYEIVGIVLWCGLPAAALALGGGWWLMRKGLSPVTALTRAAENASERNLGEPLARSRNGDELDRLTEVFNAMTVRLHGSFQRIREFTLHASHELKTPLTILRGEMETQLENAGHSSAQRESLLSQLDEVQRLTRIVDGLSLLTKADAGQVRLNLEPVRLDELVRDACADAQILAKPYSVSIGLGACDAVTVRGDRHRLRQLLLNLTDNAVKYNQPGGGVDVELRCLGQSVAELTVSNTGKGIPPERLVRVFDRFWRGDESHNGEVDGCGLGLSICEWIVNAHSGSIKLTSLPSEFTKVAVTIPADTTAAVLKAPAAEVARV